MFRASDNVEAFLNERGVKWEYVEGLEFNALVDGWSSVNYGRDKAREEETILDYASRMERGSAAPAPIGHRTQKGIEILDGVQRLCAADTIGATLFPMYVVSTNSPKIIHGIRIGSNSSLNGHRPPPAWELQNAVRTLHYGDRMSATDISGWIGRRKEDVQTEIDIQRVQGVVESAGYHGNMPRGWLKAASKLDHVDLGSDGAKNVAKCFSFLEKVSSPNGLAKELFDRLADTKRKKGIERETQVKSILQEFSARPEIHSKLTGQKMSKDAIAVRELRAAVNAFSKLRRGGHQFEDEAFCDELVVLVAKLLFELRSICPGYEQRFRFDGSKV